MQVKYAVIAISRKNSMEGGVGGGLGSRYAGSRKPAYPPRPGRAEKIFNISGLLRFFQRASVHHISVSLVLTDSIFSCVARFLIYFVCDFMYGFAQNVFSADIRRRTQAWGMEVGDRNS